MVLCQKIKNSVEFSYQQIYHDKLAHPPCDAHTGDIRHKVQAPFCAPPQTAICGTPYSCNIAWEVVLEYSLATQRHHDTFQTPSHQG